MAELAFAALLVLYGAGAVIVALRQIKSALRGKQEETFLGGLVKVYGWPVDAWLWWRGRRL